MHAANKLLGINYIVLKNKLLHVSIEPGPVAQVAGFVRLNSSRAGIPKQ
jgi:hypothetical protein